MRQAPEVPQIVGKIRMIGSKLPLPGFDGLFQLITLQAKIVQAGHGEYPF